jgi:hypothetical protein
MRIRLLMPKSSLVVGERTGQGRVRALWEDEAPVDQPRWRAHKGPDGRWIELERPCEMLPVGPDHESGGCVSYPYGRRFHWVLAACLDRRIPHKEQGTLLWFNAVGALG